MRATTKKSNNGGKPRVRGSKPTPAKRVRPLAPKQFVDIIERMNDGLVVLDKDWRYVYVNQKAALMLQRQKPSDLIGKHIWTEYPEGMGQPFQLAYEKAMREQVSIVFEDHYEPWDLWFENRIYPSPDSLLILFTEITDRKRIEVLLRERQYLLQKILDTEPGIVYIYDLAERRNVYVNRYWLQTLGYTEEETQAMGDRLSAQLFHPEDRERILAHHENWQQAGEGDIREIEFRVRSKSGEWRWLYSREAAFARDEAGRVKQILGITHDITEQKLVQEALKRSEQQLALIYDTVSDITFLISIEPDERYRFVSVNRAFLQATGLKSEQVIGRYVDEIIPPLSQPLVLANYRRAIQEKVPIIWEEVSEYPAGQKTTIVTVNAVYDQAGICTHLVGAVHDITERKQVEKALRESEEKFSKVFYASPIPLSINRMSDGRYVEINESFSKRLEYQRQEVLGRTGLELGLWAEPSERAKMLQILREHGSLRNFEGRFRTKSGEIGTALLFREVVELAGEKHLIGTSLDITERKRMEEALRESEKRYQLISTVASDYMFSTQLDADGRLNLNWVAGAFESITGYTLEEYVAHGGWRSTLHPDDLAVDDRDLENLRSDRPVISEVRTLTKDGKLVWVRVYAQPVLDAESKKLTGIYGAVQDITERKRAEDGLRQLNEDLERRIAARTEELAAAMIKAQESDRLKSAFLATMSHELRTPLNSIIGFTGVILQGLAGPLNEEQTKQLGMIRDSARHLLALINDVLDISKIEAGQLEILKGSFNMRQAIESALRVVQPLVQKKNLPLETSIGSSVGIINNDRRRVEQVLINLVNNAIKFTERGMVRVECQIKDRWLEISVQDDGIGIKPEDMNKLFKPFQQIDTGLARGHEGTGLGLAICQHLVIAMGGEMTVESQWGIGSTFKFTLPV